MARSKLSSQTQIVLDALADEPERWQYGYDLLRLTGLKSGSLYPILMRLTERGWLEATWEQDAPEGRPRRHLYRPTAEGVRAAREARASSVPGPAVARPARSAG